MNYFERLMALEDDVEQHALHRCPLCSRFTDGENTCSKCKEVEHKRLTVRRMPEDFPGEYRDADALPNSEKERRRPAMSVIGDSKLYEDDEVYANCSLTFPNRR